MFRRKEIKEFYRIAGKRLGEADLNTCSNDSFKEADDPSQRTFILSSSKTPIQLTNFYPSRIRFLTTYNEKTITRLIISMSPFLRPQPILPPFLTAYYGIHGIAQRPTGLTLAPFLYSILTILGACAFPQHHLLHPSSCCGIRS